MSDAEYLSSLRRETDALSDTDLRALGLRRTAPSGDPPPAASASSEGLWVVTANEGGSTARYAFERWEAAKAEYDRGCSIESTPITLMRYVPLGALEQEREKSYQLRLQLDKDARSEDASASSKGELGELERLYRAWIDADTDTPITVRAELECLLLRLCPRLIEAAREMAAIRGKIPVAFSDMPPSDAFDKMRTLYGMSDAANIQLRAQLAAAQEKLKRAEALRDRLWNEGDEVDAMLAEKLRAALTDSKAREGGDDRLVALLEGEPEAKGPAPLVGRVESYVRRLRVELAASKRQRGYDSICMRQQQDRIEALQAELAESRREAEEWRHASLTISDQKNTETRRAETAEAERDAARDAGAEARLRCADCSRCGEVNALPVCAQCWQAITGHDTCR